MISSLNAMLLCALGMSLLSQGRLSDSKNSKNFYADTLKSTAAISPTSPAPGMITTDTLRKYPNQAFSTGEYLRFEVNYEFITVGEAVMRISDTVYHDNRKCLEVNFSVKSKSFFDLVYRVRDR